MTPTQYKSVLDKLGIPVASQSTTAILGISVRQSLRYAAGHSPIPEPLHKLLRLAINLRLTTDEIQFPDTVKGRFK